MPGWTTDELNRIGTADELHVAGTRSDGSLRKPVIVWVVRVGDDLYTRSVNGPDAGWFRGVQRRHEGHVSAGGVDKDVTFVDVNGAVDDDVDAAYQAKYGGYSGPVASIVSPHARSTTVQLSPRA
jgi:hypothetical protein